MHTMAGWVTDRVANAAMADLHSKSAIVVHPLNPRHVEPLAIVWDEQSAATAPFGECLSGMRPAATDCDLEIDGRAVKGYFTVRVEAGGGSPLGS